MADLNLEENVLKLTLGDIVQQFTEEDLQREMPVFMQDIDAETKNIVDTWQAYLEEGNFAEAEAYRAAHPQLDTRIWDARKANSFMAYAAFAYLYARNKKQQVVISDTEPHSYEENPDDFQAEGDIWLKVNGKKNDVVLTTPYQRQKDGTYKEFSVTKTLEAKNVTYDNSVSGIDALTVQEGIDEMAKNSKILENSVSEINGNLSFPDGEGFYLDERNGVKGYNTDPQRGADTFTPFSNCDIFVMPYLLGTEELGGNTCAVYADSVEGNNEPKDAFNFTSTTNNGWQSKAVKEANLIFYTPEPILLKKIVFVDKNGTLNLPPRVVIYASNDGENYKVLTNPITLNSPATWKYEEAANYVDIDTGYIKYKYYKIACQADSAIKMHIQHIQLYATFEGELLSESDGQPLIEWFGQKSVSARGRGSNASASYCSMTLIDLAPYSFFQVAYRAGGGKDIYGSGGGGSITVNIKDTSGNIVVTDRRSLGWSGGSGIMALNIEEVQCRCIIEISLSAYGGHSYKPNNGGEVSYTGSASVGALNFVA